MIFSTMLDMMVFERLEIGKRVNHKCILKINKKIFLFLGVAGTFKEEMGAGFKSSVAHKLKMKNRELMFYDKTSKMPEFV